MWSPLNTGSFKLTQHRSAYLSRSRASHMKVLGAMAQVHCFCHTSRWRSSHSFEIEVRLWGPLYFLGKCSHHSRLGHRPLSPHSVRAIRLASAPPHLSFLLSSASLPLRHLRILCGSAMATYRIIRQESRIVVHLGRSQHLVD